MLRHSHAGHTALQRLMPVRCVLNVCMQAVQRGQGGAARQRAHRHEHRAAPPAAAPDRGAFADSTLQLCGTKVAQAQRPPNISFVNSLGASAACYCRLLSRGLHADTLLSICRQRRRSWPAFCTGNPAAATPGTCGGSCSRRPGTLTALRSRFRRAQPAQVGCRPWVQPTKARNDQVLADATLAADDRM